MYVASGVPRLVLGVGILVWRPTAAAAMAGVLLGAIVPVLVGLRVLGRGSRGPGAVSEHHGTRRVLREIRTSSQTLLAFLVLMNCDVVLARNVLDPHEAGLYAGGQILTKAMLFLPQFVVVVAFPALSTVHERRRALGRGLAFITALGAAGVLACAALPQLALVFVGGDAYAEIADQLWLFAVLGTVLSLIQLLVYLVLARQGTRSTYLVWGALALLLAVGSQMHTFTGLLLAVVAIDSALFVTLLLVGLHRLGADDR
jgi:O-antigen/teichoic acid export membrane protein